METMNEELTRQFTKEVEVNIKQMAPLNSLRPDDLNLGFYQTYWHIKGEKVTSIVLKFLNEGSFDKCINFTYLALIPKNKCPNVGSNFKPINLCNVIYKLM